MLRYRNGPNPQPQADPKSDPLAILQGIDANVTRLATSDNETRAALAALEARIGAVEKQPSVPGCMDGKRKPTFQNIIRGVTSGNWSEYQLELDIHREACKSVGRSAGTTPNAQLGYLVPTQLLAEIIEYERAANVLNTLGVRTLSGLSVSEVVIPRQITTVTPVARAEKAAVTEHTGPTLDAIRLTPHSTGVIAGLSNELLSDSSPSAEAFIRQDIAEAMALEKQRQHLLGTGALGEMLGIFVDSNLPSTDGSTSQIVDATYITETWFARLEDNNAILPSSRLGILAHPGWIRRLKNLRIAHYSGQAKTAYPGWVLNPFMSDEQLGQQLGKTIASTTQLTNAGTSKAGGMLYGDWSQYIMADWGTLEILGSNIATVGSVSAFANNMTFIRALMRIDGAIRRPNAFHLIYNDATT